MLGVFAYYAYYFFLLKSFVNVFVQEIPFTTDGLQKSGVFLWLNTVPVLYWLSSGCYYQLAGSKEVAWFGEGFLVLAIHLLVMLVIYLCRIILKKGIVLQQEQDYTI